MRWGRGGWSAFSDDPGLEIHGNFEVELFHFVSRTQDDCEIRRRRPHWRTSNYMTHIAGDSKHTHSGTPHITFTLPGPEDLVTQISVTDFTPKAASTAEATPVTIAGPNMNE